MDLFESIKHVSPKTDTEYWFARELQPVLGYTQWRRFKETIDRAKTACETSGIKVSEHFADVGKSYSMPNGGVREIGDIAMTRYACYLTVQNGDPSKDVKH